MSSSDLKHKLACCLFLVLLLSIPAGCVHRARTPVVNEPEETAQPESSQAIAQKQTKYFEPKVHYIFFNKNETRFNDSYANELVIVFDELKKFKNSCLEVYGYDSIDKDYVSSKRLAGQRAEWTRRCLVGEGVDGQFIKVVQGMEPVRLPRKPTAEDAKQARRVEVHVVPCDDAEFKVRTKAAEIDKDNPFKYKQEGAK